MQGVRRKSVAAVTGAFAMLLAVPGVSWAADWKGLSETLIKIDQVCRDGVRFGAAVRADSEVETIAFAAQPASEDSGSDLPPDDVALRQPLDLDPVPEGTTIAVPDNGEDVQVSRLTEKVTLPFTHRGEPGGARRELDLAPVGINLEGFSAGSGTAIEQVTNCYLFAPIDVVPGNSANPVPVGHGRVKVAVLSSSTFSAELVNPRRYRLGAVFEDPEEEPVAAAPGRFTLTDVNDDDRDDLVLTFDSAAAGITCGTAQLRLTGRTAGRDYLEGRSSVQPVAEDCGS